jgi:hypothetical protein
LLHHSQQPSKQAKASGRFCLCPIRRNVYAYLASLSVKKRTNVSVEFCKTPISSWK